MVMDTDTFKRELLPHHRLLYRIAYRLTESTSSAEDMVQETYAKLWDKRVELNNIENYKAFAIIVLRNLCLDHLRKIKDKIPINNELEYLESTSLSSEIEQKDEIRHIKTLINKLPDQQRKVMILKHWDNCSDEEIEQVTGLTQVNIRVILSRARKAIKEQFNQLR